MAKRASIDIGSNTTLLLIGEVDSESLIHELENESRVTALGKNLDKTKVFAEQSMSDTFDALKEYKALIEKHGVNNDSVYITATEASRVAQNANEFFTKVKSELGLHIQKISGEGEAYYTAFGVVKGAGALPENITIMDIGGASTELIKIKTSPFEILSTVSLPLGSVRCTDWKSEGILDQKFEEIKASFDSSLYQTDHLLCVAGSMTSLGSMIKGLNEFDASEVNGTKISYQSFIGFLDKLKDASADDLLHRYPFLGKRAASIQGGALLGKFMGDLLNVKTFEISTLGLRYGTIIAGEINERFCR